MHNYTIRQILMSHQRTGKGWCSCGEQYFEGFAQHQLDMLEADGYDTN